ncbi:hypothetical protein SYK_03200 [Pseudodesulfovibrio nedwellii]|uniref:Uncharacterized protein n=1 Tax=Pseudodesulfovibrio nedwellii TaxID=2973072 RepID=A0ABN6S0V2_9BACT|nr:hypothetical protein SYK_03200 [Pseudodesulfovibrio nedwellii]
MDTPGFKDSGKRLILINHVDSQFLSRHGVTPSKNFYMLSYTHFVSGLSFFPVNQHATIVA